MEIITPLIPSVVVSVAPRLISYKRMMSDRIVHGNKARLYHTREWDQIVSYMGFNEGKRRKWSEAVQRVCAVKWSPIVTLSDYLYASHTQTYLDCIFSLSRSLHKALTPILVPLHHNLCHHCTIWSDSSLSVQYNLLQVRLSLGDTYWPLLSFTYINIYVEKYINCTTRTLRP